MNEDATMNKAKAKKGSGSSISIQTRAEISGLVHAAARRWRDRLPDEAWEGMPDGERSGYAYVFERLICWSLSLSDEDFDRIQEEGRELVARVNQLPPDHQGAPPILRRTESVLASAGAEAPARARDRKSKR